MSPHFLRLLPPCAGLCCRQSRSQNKFSALSPHLCISPSRDRVLRGIFLGVKVGAVAARSSEREEHTFPSSFRVRSAAPLFSSLLESQTGSLFGCWLVSRCPLLCLLVLRLRLCKVRFFCSSWSPIHSADGVTEEDQKAAG